MPPASSNSEDIEVTSSLAPIPEKEQDVAHQQAKSGNNWRFSAYTAFGKGDLDKAKEVFETHLRSESDPDQRYFSEALYLYFSYSIGGVTESINRLNDLVDRSKSEEQKMLALPWLAACYDSTKSYEKTAGLWEVTLREAQSEQATSGAARGLATAYQNLNQLDRASEVLSGHLEALEDQACRNGLLETLADIEKENGNEQVAALIYELLMEAKPGDREILFQAAYCQSDANLPLLSLRNYETLLGLAPSNAYANNNLAVCANELKVKSKAVELYQRSAELNETLAMANLARKHLESGFFNEARELLNKASSYDNPDKDVASALTTLNTREEKDEKAWKKLRKKADAFHQNSLQYIQAYLSSAHAPSAFAGQWMLDDETVIVTTVDGTSLSAEWETKPPTDALGIGFTRSAPITYDVSLKGSVTNGSAAVEYLKTRSKTSPPSGLLGAFGSDPVDCFSYLTADASTWRIFSEKHDKDFDMTLRRVTT